MRKQIIIFLALACMCVGSMKAFAPAQYQVKQKYVLGGEGGWDYLTFDSAGKRLFISRGTHVMVVDPYKGTVLGDIPDTPGVHGIALAQELGKGFTSNGRDNTITVFDLKTLKETARIKIEGENPDAILYDASSKRVFTFNGRSKNATAVDATTGTVIGNIPLDGKPEFGVADGKGMVFVNIEDKSEVTSIDAKKAAVVKSWPLAPCEEPSGLAMDLKNRRLFSGCHNKMMAVMDADTGKVIATPAIGEGVDANAFDAEKQLAFSSNGDGTLTVVHEDSPDKFSVLENAETQKFARTMALDTTNHDVYLVTAEIEMAPPAKEGERPRRTMKPGTFTLLVVGSAGAPAMKDAPKEAPKGKKPAAAVEAPKDSATKDSATQALYKSKCQICHGADGAGSAAGKKLGAKAFTSAEAAKESDSEMFDITKKGKGKMPSFDKKLTDDQIKALVKYIRSLK
ncbi:MAG: c-type cytochrome [Acidobacteriia bacterium]|nr:c-type cytochrome [Terriglobia bacterium]